MPPEALEVPSKVVEAVQNVKTFQQFLLLAVGVLFCGLLYLLRRQQNEADECEKKHEKCESTVLDLSVKVARLESKAGIQQ